MQPSASYNLRLRPLAQALSWKRLIDTLLATGSIVSFPAAPFATHAVAQEAPAAAEKPAATEEASETVKLEEFVVSGTVAPRRKLESAAAVTTIDFEQIKISVPRGAPELMKLVPGVFPIRATPYRPTTARTTANATRASPRTTAAVSPATSSASSTTTAAT